MSGEAKKADFVLPLVGWAEIGKISSDYETLHQSGKLEQNFSVKASFWMQRATDHHLHSFLVVYPNVSGTQSWYLVRGTQNHDRYHRQIVSCLCFTTSGQFVPLVHMQWVMSNPPVKGLSCLEPDEAVIKDLIHAAENNQPTTLDKVLTHFAERGVVSLNWPECHFFYRQYAYILNWLAFSKTLPPENALPDGGVVVSRQTYDLGSKLVLEDYFDVGSLAQAIDPKSEGHHLSQENFRSLKTFDASMNWFAEHSVYINKLRPGKRSEVLESFSSDILVTLLDAGVIDAADLASRFKLLKEPSVPDIAEWGSQHDDKKLLKRYVDLTHFNPFDYDYHILSRESYNRFIDLLGYTAQIGDLVQYTDYRQYPWQGQVARTLALLRLSAQYLDVTNWKDREYQLLKSMLLDQAISSTDFIDTLSSMTSIWGENTSKESLYLLFIDYQYVPELLAIALDNDLLDESEKAFCWDNLQEYIVRQFMSDREVGVPEKIMEYLPADMLAFVNFILFSSDSLPHVDIARDFYSKPLADVVVKKVSDCTKTQYVARIEEVLQWNKFFEEQGIDYCIASKGVLNKFRHACRWGAQLVKLNRRED